MLESSPMAREATFQRSLHIKTFGCQMNEYDSSRMKAILATKGFRQEADLMRADVILLNTCAIRDKAEQKVRTLLGQLRGIKDKRPNVVIGVTGCVGQRIGRTLLQRVPHLDLVVGPDRLDRIGNLVEEVSKGGKRFVETGFDKLERNYSQPLITESVTSPSEFLTVMKGCDHFCTYCIVPFVRGREKSRPIDEILGDVTNLVSKGTKEVIFLGQNINTYGKGTSENLAELIERTNKIEGLERIRYVTSHPADLGDDLVSQFGAVEKLCPQLHLPFQSGSDRILKAMGRLHTKAEYLKRVEKLRRTCPEMAISTDVIVGFPGETESDFQQTLSLLDEVGFSSAFMFTYCERPGTRAASSEDDVPQKTKSDRLKRAQELVYSLVEKENQKRIGSLEECLIEKIDKKKRYFMGRTKDYKIVHVFNAGLACVGKIIKVNVTEASGSNLKGYYVDAPRNRRTQDTLSLSLS